MSSSPSLRAWGALALTIVIWAGYLVAARATVTTKLGIAEVGLMRFAPALLLLSPVLMRHGPLPRGAGWRELLGIGILGGFGFVGLLATGLKFAPVADSGVFTPSMLPFFVAILSALFLGERLRGLRLLGLALILTGALAVGGWEALSHAGSGAWRGHLLFLTASFAWAIYTVRFRIAPLEPLPAAAMIAFWSTLAFLALGIVNGMHFGAAPLGFVLLQTLFQGVLSGFVATITYFVAVRAFGPSQVAAFAALVPVLAALGGWLFLAEPIGWLKGTGIMIVAVGVALASGALSRRQGVVQQRA